MASSISISSAILPPRPSSHIYASFSSSNSSFFCTCSAQSRRLLGQLRSSTTTSKTRRSSSKKGFSCNCLFGLGVAELAVIAGVAALVFGPKKLPEVGRSIGKTVKSFQQAAKEFESELKKDPESVGDSSVEQVKEVSNKEEGEDVKVSTLKES